MSAPLVLKWSIHSRDALHALERLIAWLYPYHWRTPPRGPFHVAASER